MFKETMIDGDGTRSGGKTGKYMKNIGQKSKKNIDVLAMACALAGIPISISNRKMNDEDYWELRIIKNKYVWADQLTYDKQPYKGIVWCPRTDVGTFLARREGKVYWTGNTFPTATHVNIFASTRFKPMIEGSNYLSMRMRDNVDNASVKMIGGHSPIYFGGTTKASQGISTPADMLVHDELDFSDMEIIEVYTKRLAASNFKLIREFSTPTLPEYGIDKKFKLSDQNYWMVKCGCGKWQSPRFPDNILKTRKGKYYWGCKFCGKRMDRRKGKWIPKFPERTKHDRGMRGYYVPQSISPIISASYLHSEHKKSLIDPTGEKHFFNFNLAKPYESGSDIITREVVLQSLTAPSQDGYIFMGVDQGDLLHIEICKLAGRRREVIYVEVTNSFDRVHQLIEQFEPMRVVMDALPNKHPAKQVIEKYGQAYIAYYTNLDGLWNPRQPDKLKNELNINHLDAMDNTAAQWNRGEAVLTTAVDAKMHERFAEQMTNVKRDTIQDKSGQNIPRWVKVGADHFRHADLYCYIASKMPKMGDGSEAETSGLFTPPDFGGYALFGQEEVW